MNKMVDIFKHKALNVPINYVEGKTAKNSMKLESKII